MMCFQCWEELNYNKKRSHAREDIKKRFRHLTTNVRAVLGRLNPDAKSH